MNIGHTARRTPNGAAFRAVALVATALGLAVCNGPTGEGEDGPALTLSLGEPGVYEYDFDGNPVTVLLACADTVRYGTIRWYADSSAAVDRIGSARADDKVVGAMVRMWWTGYPKLLDSASRVRYDTVFARAETPDGRLLTSNVVRVNIRNMAPRVDSIAVGDTVLHNRDSVYAVDIGESTAVHIRIYGRDADKDQFHVDWFPESDNVEELTADGRLIRYTAPGRPFRDTVVFSVTDRFGVKAADSLQITANEIPVIDSVRVLSSADTVTFVASNSRFEYYTDGDSLGFHVFGSDRDHIDLTFIWQHKGFYIDTVAPKTGQYRMYFDGSQTDTVIVKAFDAIGDFAVDTMIIYP